MEKLLEVSDLHVAFPSKRETVRAVDGVSFQVFQGETFGLVGESGCGKSQTLRSILGLLKQPGRITGGEIRYKGADIAKMSQRELQKIRGKEISMIFQEPMTALNPVLRIRSQMYEAFEGEKLSKEEKRRRAIELLKLVGIPSPETRLDEYPHQLSGGMRQRVMIAMALSCNPELLIADEPTTALDVTIQAQILELLNELKDKLGMAIIFITHDLGVISEMADEVVVMYAGEIVEKAETRQLFDNPMHPYTEGLMASIPDIDQEVDRLQTLEGLVPSLYDMPSGCRFGPRCKYYTEECGKNHSQLTRLEGQREVRCRRYQHE
jgi:oligopeptide/dipeptide ABC transporter ATP-binding protein